MRKRVRLTAIALAGCGLVALSACSGSSTPTPASSTVAGGTSTGGSTPTKGGVLRLGVRKTDVATFDPADVSPTVQPGMIAEDLLFDGLTVVDPATKKVGPALATTIAPNADLSVWTFPLRDDARFSDGTPVTATDVKFTLERLAQKGKSSLAGSALEVIAGYLEYLGGAPELTGVKAPDEHTVEITTRGPYAALPDLLASPLFGVVPKHAVESPSADFGLKPIGSGPFAFVSQDDTTIELARAKGSPALLDGVRFVLFGDRNEPVQALKEGKVDWAAVPPFTAVESVQDLGAVQPGARSSEEFYAFNLNDPIYGDGRDAFRQAIVKAVDRQRIARTILNSRDPLNGVIPPEVPGSQPDPCGEPCAHDVAAAKQLVAQAFPDGNVPTVEIDSYTGPNPEDQVQEKVANAIVADLSAAGIPAQAVIKPFEEYRTFAVSAGRKVFMYGWVGLAADPDMYLRPLFSSLSEYNTTGFKNGDVDFALARAKATTDPNERLALYKQIEQQIMATVPIIPLAGLDSSVVVSKNVHGYAARFDGTFAAERVSLG